MAPSAVISAARTSWPDAGSDPRYIVTARLDAGRWTRTGWGLFATANGASRDLSAHGAWTPDAEALPGEIEAGFGWRLRNLSAVLGYAQPAADVRSDRLDRPGPHGLVGFSVALRSR